MKKYLIVLALFMSHLAMIAGGHGQNPPVPIRGPGPPPGLPINQYLVVLFVIGLLLIVYKQQKRVI